MYDCVVLAEDFYEASIDKQAIRNTTLEILVPSKPSRMNHAFISMIFPLIPAPAFDHLAMHKVVYASGRNQIQYT